MKFPGVQYCTDGHCLFRVWAPEKELMTLHLPGRERSTIPMQKSKDGYFTVTLDNITPGTRYMFQPEGDQPYPDPAAQWQPEGVHKASAVVDHKQYQWQDGNWKGMALRDMVMYELHIGTFTQEGTFEAVISRLDELYDIGINAIEIMPVAQFPGERNWGYDGAFPYAVQNAYGGPQGLKKLVDACHQKGVAVFLDVVYNHLGPEGNYFSKFGPYFTNEYCTPWGDAVNFDGEWSDGVKDFFVQNVLYWLELYHIDGLRLDAIHTVHDNNARTFWDIIHEEKKALEQRTGRLYYLVAESDLNSPKVTRHPELGGYGFDAQWLDDFHHALYTLLHKEGKDRYEDFGFINQLAKAYTDGFVHAGEYVKFRKRRHGTSSAGVPGDRFIVFNQNHDQVGNRIGGERLCMLVDFERQKMATAAILLSPYVPMLFMGEEYSDDAPFFYFVSHSDPELIDAVRQGRKKEFEAFKDEGEMPDAQDETTFLQSKLNWEKRYTGRHAIILQWHKQLIQLRRSLATLQSRSKNDIQAYCVNSSLLVLHRQTSDGLQHTLIFFNFSEETMFYSMSDLTRQWRKILDSKEEQWMEDVAESISAERISTGENLSIPACCILVYEGVGD